MLEAALVEHLDALAARQKVIFKLSDPDRRRLLRRADRPIRREGGAGRGAVGRLPSRDELLDAMLSERTPGVDQPASAAH